MANQRPPHTFIQPGWYISLLKKKQRQIRNEAVCLQRPKSSIYFLKFKSLCYLLLIFSMNMTKFGNIPWKLPTTFRSTERHTYEKQDFRLVPAARSRELTRRKKRRFSSLRTFVEHSWVGCQGIYVSVPCLKERARMRSSKRTVMGNDIRTKNVEITGATEQNWK